MATVIFTVGRGANVVENRRDRFFSSSPVMRCARVPAAAISLAPERKLCLAGAIVQREVKIAELIDRGPDFHVARIALFQQILREFTPAQPSVHAV